jgi:hypothetical protein
LINKRKAKTVFIFFILIIWAMWLGYRLRREDNAIKENDAKADAYFDSIDAVNKK